MKKIIAPALALMLALSLTACGGNSKSSPANSNTPSPTDSGTSTVVPTDSLANTDSQPAPQVTALDGSKIFIDLVEVPTDIPTQVADGITMVPVQAVMETIGYDVNWIPEEQRLEVWEPSRQHPTIILNIGNTTAYYEKYVEELGERVSYEATLEIAPILVEGTMFAQLSFVAESVGFTVDSNVDTTDVYFFSPEYMENQEGEGIGEDQIVDKSGQPGEGIGEDQIVDKSGQPGEGIGTDQAGEGIGETQPLTEDEKSYVLSIRTQNWLDLKQAKKEEVIFLMARWWDLVDGYIVEDFDSVLADLDHQMETYSRNGVDEGILQTACDIYGLDASKYIQ